MNCKLITVCRYLLILSTVFLLVSCITFNDSGYDRLSDEEKKHVKVCDVPMSQIQYDGNIYQVNVGQVKNYMQDIPHLIVYEYLPFCSAPSCVPPMHVLMFCKKKGLRLCLISSVYDGLFQLQQRTIPLFVIDHTLYGTDNYQHYSRQFYDTLTGVSEEEREYHSYHYFKYGRYICSYGSLESIHRQ